MRCTTLLLTATGLFLSASLYAQLFDLGIKGGANRDNLSTEYSDDGLWGANIGLFTRVKAPIIPGIQGEVMLTSIGARVTALGETAELRTVAVQTPVFAVVALGPVELHGGVYYEHYLTRTIASRFNINLDEVQNELPVEAGRLSDDGWGYMLGAGVRFNHFYAGARYNIGAEPLGSGPFLGDVHSRQIQAYIGVGLFQQAKSSKHGKAHDGVQE